jgi:RNA polymerase sigma-70 factor, ECF subfamily
MEKTILTLQVAPETSVRVPAGPSDEALMDLIKDRVHGALTMLFNRHRQTVAAVVAQAVASEGQREALMKTVFNEIWNRAEFYTEESGRALGWIITLARRCAKSAQTAGALAPAQERRVSKLTLAPEENLTQVAA